MRNPCEGLMNRVGVQSKWARRAFYTVIARASPSNPDDMLLLLLQQYDDFNDIIVIITIIIIYVASAEKNARECPSQTELARSKYGYNPI